MNFPSAIAIATAFVAVYVGAQARRFARAPGWEDLRWFGLIAYAAAAFGLGNVASTLGWPDGAVVLAARIQLAAGMAQLWGWLHYVDALSARLPGPLARRLRLLPLAGSAAALVPGLLISGTVVTRPLLDVTCRDALPTPLGAAVIAAALAGGALALARLVAAARRGVAGAGIHALALGALLLLALNDTAAQSGAANLPLLLDAGFLLPLGVVGWSVTRRFVADATALQVLRKELEAQVEARTRALARTEEALHQAEKLAALGQFAAGVAHEVNNPAAVVTANLRYLADAIAAGEAPPDAAQSLGESIAAMQRINGLVRRLVDAGRVSSFRPSAGTASVLRAVEAAIQQVRPRTGDRVTFPVEVDGAAAAAIRGEVLLQIVTALLANGAEAIPPHATGRVAVSARRLPERRLEIVVEDDGVGMAPHVLRRAFEPFFTTRRDGHGSGLGLPVARALAESHGGRVTLESEPGRGTRAVVELPATEAA